MKDNIDFSICDFIEERMWFFTYYDFCDNRKQIKQDFDALTLNQKRFYRWYVYANVRMSESFKNKIWDYLNGYDKSGSELIRAKQFYRVK